MRAVSAMWLTVSLALAPAMLAAQTVRTAEPNTNRAAAGSYANGRLVIDLVVERAEWSPEDDRTGPRFVVWAVGEAGHAPQIPAPLLRVPVGTEVVVTIRNGLAEALAFHGLHDQPLPDDRPLLVAGGGTAAATFRVTTPGTFLYWAASPDVGFEDREFDDGHLVGALIVDDPALPSPPDERVFVITESFRFDDNDEIFSGLVINGKGWPYTERLTYTQNDSVHWRWINGSVLAHPMHLHGFYYEILAKGLPGRMNVYAPAERRRVVTELMAPGETMNLAFLPTTPGNWVFHCHLGLHVSGIVSLDDAMRLSVQEGHGGGLGERHMAGLVMGMHVLPDPDALPVTEPAARTLRLLIQQREGAFDHGETAYGFVLENGGEPARDSVEVPGPVLELRKDERVRIRMINHLDQPTGVHWHGLEIESYPDGVPGWSGTPGNILPSIAPGDSLTVEFKPPRAGTFMYHSHLGESAQINRGLYGALIVRDPGTPPVREQIVVIGAGGTHPEPLKAFESPYALVNGRRFHRPVELAVGETVRFRLVSIHQDWRVRVTLAGDDGYARWRTVAKDGADLPASQAVEVPAHWIAGPGETADFDFTGPSAGRYRLEIRTMDPGWYIPIEVIVK